MFECGFIYVAGGLDPETHRAVIPSENINMNVIGCADYAQAEKAACELVEKGCDAIELCAGFSNEGVARIQKAVGPDVVVGAVRFDLHPAFGYKSGNEAFS